jgi:hypothetical protein
LVVNDTHITLRLRKEKGRQSLREGQNNTRQILKEDMPRVAKALQAFFRLTATTSKMRVMRWAISAEEDGCEWTASTSTIWLPSICWTSHSLRKGVASAANAIKVHLNDIRYAGGWSTNSTVLEAKYIDFSMPPSKAAYIFFGHLKRDTPFETGGRNSSSPLLNRPRAPP